MTGAAGSIVDVIGRTPGTLAGTIRALKERIPDLRG